jgi:hypothetical protein
MKKPWARARQSRNTTTGFPYMAASTERQSRTAPTIYLRDPPRHGPGLMTMTRATTAHTGNLDPAR